MSSVIQFIIHEGTFDPEGFYMEFDEQETLEIVFVILISQLQLSPEDYVFVREATSKTPLKVFYPEHFQTTLKAAGVTPFGSLHLKKKSHLSLEERNTNQISIPFIDQPNGSAYIVDLPLQFIPSTERYYPYLGKISELPDMANILENDPRNPEFCFSWTFHPELISEICYNGCFPMAIQIFERKYAMAIKLSHVQCVLKYEDLHIPKTVKKKSKRYDVSVNLAFEEVVAKCVQVKGENWLCPPLCHSFIEMHKSPEKFKPKLTSFEVWEGDKLVAGEIGFIIGSIYTSLTGFYFIKGTGTIQLCATGVLLHQAGIVWWDFEMSHKYKLELGAKEIPRREWHAEHHKHRDTPLTGEITCNRKNIHTVLTM